MTRLRQCTMNALELCWPLVPRTFLPLVDARRRSCGFSRQKTSYARVNLQRLSRMTTAALRNSPRPMTSLRSRGCCMSEASSAGSAEIRLLSAPGHPGRASHRSPPAAPKRARIAAPLRRVAALAPGGGVLVPAIQLRGIPIAAGVPRLIAGDIAS